MISLNISFSSFTLSKIDMFLSTVQSNGLMQTSQDYKSQYAWRKFKYARLYTGEGLNVSMDQNPLASSNLI